MKRRELTELLSYFLAVVSLTLWMRGNFSAIEWPAIDSAPLLMSWESEGILKNDFFTQTSLIPNPRWIFASIVSGLGKLTGLGWYPIFFILKTMFITLLPALYFQMIVKHVPLDGNKRRSRNILIFVAFIGVILLFHPFYMKQFVVAWWQPFRFDAHPATFSVFVIFLSYVMSENLVFRSVATFVATLVHPAVGLMAAFFVTALQYLRRKGFHSLIPFAFSLLGALAVSVFFRFFGYFQMAMSAKDAAFYYTIESHSLHYYYKLLAQSGYIPPYIMISLIILFNLIVASILLKTRKTRYAIVSSVLVFAYFFSVMAQILFVNLWPVKLLVYFGPIRFVMYGYWISGISLLLCFSDNSNLVSRRYSVPCVVLLIFSILFGLFMVDDYKRDSIDEYPILNWAMENTNEDDVFLITDDPVLALFPIVAERAVYTGNGFPFVERSFKEYTKRKAMVFGSYEEKENMKSGSIDAKMIKHYNALTIDDLIEINDYSPYDYIVVADNADDLPDDRQTWRDSVEAIIYSDTRYTVYDLDLLLAP